MPARAPLLIVALLAAVSAPAAPQTAPQTAPPYPATYLPRAGEEDPALRAGMARLLAPRGVRSPVRLVIVEPDWQIERMPQRGLIARRTRNAAVLYRDPAHPERLLLRYALFAMDWNGRGRGGRYGAVYLRELGTPRPFTGVLPPP